MAGTGPHVPRGLAQQVDRTTLATFNEICDRLQDVAKLTDVTGTADAAYSANEVTLINDLVTKVNAILAAIRG